MQPMLGFFVSANILLWASSLPLASLFPFFTFKEEYTEHFLRGNETPSSRRSLYLTFYGACNSFFIADWAQD